MTKLPLAGKTLYAINHRTCVLFGQSCLAMDQLYLIKVKPILSHTVILVNPSTLKIWLAISIKQK
jgi:hypothetical protein